LVWTLPLNYHLLLIGFSERNSMRQSGFEFSRASNQLNTARALNLASSCPTRLDYWRIMKVIVKE
jgi:hypothetical protein